jgi:hypothetical protein
VEYSDEPLSSFETFGGCIFGAEAEKGTGWNLERMIVRERFQGCVVTEAIRCALESESYTPEFWAPSKPVPSLSF